MWNHDRMSSYKECQRADQQAVQEKVFSRLQKDIHVLFLFCLLINYLFINMQNVREQVFFTHLLHKNIVSTYYELSVEERRERWYDDKTILAELITEWRKAINSYKAMQ